MIINSHNDWDPLEEVIVGHAHHFYVNTDISSHSFSFADRKLEDIQHMEGPMPQWLIDDQSRHWFKRGQISAPGIKHFNGFGQISQHIPKVSR